MVDRRVRAEETKRQLVDSARTVFHDRGYVATSVAAITEGADTAHGTFYLYFRNKEDIFREVIQDLVAELYEHSFTSAEQNDGRVDASRMRQRIAGFLETFARQAGLWRAMLEATLTSAELAAAWQQARLSLREQVLGRWQPMAEDGRALEVDLVRAAEALMSMVEWLAFRGSVLGDSEAAIVDEEGRARPETVDVLVHIWVRAIVR